MIVPHLFGSRRAATLAVLCACVFAPLAHADIALTGTSTPATYARGRINSFLLDLHVVSNAFAGVDALTFQLPEGVTLSAVRKRNTFTFCSDIHPLVNGMKQRLSLAVALLHRPGLLILDEPTNGLDPNGIVEMRDLLTRLNREHGTTIVVSSHLLPEIEKLATHVGIIHKGRMVSHSRAAAQAWGPRPRNRLRLEQAHVSPDSIPACSAAAASRTNPPMRTPIRGVGRSEVEKTP